MITLRSFFSGLAAMTVTALPAVAAAQAAPSPFTSAIRYDDAGRATGTIAADPDGASGPLKHAATRTTIDNRGLVTKVETGELAQWQSEEVVPANWTGFEVLSSVDTAYDNNRRKISETVRGSNNIRVSLTQYSYDNWGRLECTAVRMNPATYSALPADACTQTTDGPDGPDRITRTIYDAAGQVAQIRKAVNTDLEIAEVTYGYTDNGQISQVVDANGNMAEQRYDDHDRLVKWVFPAQSRVTGFDKSTAESALQSAGALNEADYEEYSYDVNGNRTSHRKRDGSEIQFAYDALNRMSVKTVPGRTTGPDALDPAYTRNVYYTYDLRDLQTSIRFDSVTGEGSLSSWDGFGQQISVTDTMEGANRTLTYRYDTNGNRTRITHPDNKDWRFEYDGLNRANLMRRGTLQVGVMSYNKRGLVEKREYPYSSFNTVTTPSYDPAGRTIGLAHDLRGTSGDIEFDYGYIPSGQLSHISRDNEAYAWDGQPPVTVTRDYLTNGLNQYEGDGFDSFCYDANGNLTADGGYVYLYDIENRLVEMRVQGSGNAVCATLSYAGDKRAELRYDPLGRLYRIEKYETVGGVNLATDYTRFLYDGDAMVAEYNAAGTVLRRYVHGTNTDADDPLIWYEGSAVNAGSRRLLMANHQGSIIAVTNYTGFVLNVNSYDAYGVGGSANANPTAGRFQYTGQVWLPELGMYYYKARIYSSRLGRFMQTDPIGYEDQFNLYAYVGNDPVNMVDFTGRQAVPRRGIPIPFPIYGPGNPAPPELDRNGNGYPDWAEDVARNLQEGFDNAKENLRDFKDWILNDDVEVPGGLVGDQDSKSGPQGRRHLSGPLSEDHGGTGNAEGDFDTLTGGKSNAPGEGSNLPEGSRVGGNGIIYRPGTSDKGPRIDIPANGKKPHETLHY